MDKTFVLYKYIDKNGRFDYKEYVRVQVEGNKRKINSVWVKEENVIFISRYILENYGEPKFGICHGTRRGLEQKWFSEHLKCNVLGTEISDTAVDFSNTIQWDFHNVKNEWIRSCDFIYSNSYDHSYDPQKCIYNWMSCIKIGGLCILEHAVGHTPSYADNLDPFGAELIVMPYLIAKWANGEFGVKEILQAPDGASNFIVIQHFVQRCPQVNAVSPPAEPGGGHGY